jgi:VanZ family protein
MSSREQSLNYKDILKIIPALILAITIFYFSSLSKPYPTTPSKFMRLFLNPLLHICEFGALSFLIFFGLFPKVKSTYLILLSILYAFFDEIHQYFVPHRYFDLYDLILDTVGIFLGYFTYILLGLVKERFIRNNLEPNIS